MDENSSVICLGIFSPSSPLDLTIIHPSNLAGERIRMRERHRENQLVVAVFQPYPTLQQILEDSVSVKEYVVTQRAIDYREFITEATKNLIGLYLNNFADVETLITTIISLCRFTYTRDMDDRKSFIKELFEKYRDSIHFRNADKFTNFQMLESFLSSLMFSGYYIPKDIRQIIKSVAEHHEKILYNEIASESLKHPPVTVQKEIPRNSRDIYEDIVETPEYLDAVEKIFESIPCDDIAITNAMKAIYDNLVILPDEIQKKEDAIAELENIIREIYSDAELHKFGSYAGGFGTRGCDVDLCLQLKGLEEDQFDVNVQKTHLLEIQKKLKKSKNSAKILIKQEVSRSRVPVLRLEHVNYGVDMDICMGTSLGVQNTKLLRMYSSMHPNIAALVCLIKYWTKARKVSDASSGALSSYSYVLLTISYLQALGMVPSLQELIYHEECLPSDISSPPFLRGLDCRFFQNSSKIHRIWTPKRSFDDISLGKLFFGFFKYYSTIFDRKKYCVSVRLGRLVKRTSHSPIHIEDPFEIRDLGNVISEEKAPLIFNEIDRAYKQLCENASLDSIIAQSLIEIDQTNIYAKRKDYAEFVSEDALSTLEGTVHNGVLRVNAKRPHEAYITLEGFETDVFINGLEDRNRALHNDIVSVEVRNVDGKYVGKVINIIERRSPIIFSCFFFEQLEPSRYFLLIPIEKVYPKICVSYENLKKFKIFAKSYDTLFVVKLTEWPSKSRYPQGEVVSVIGLRRDLFAQKRALFIQRMGDMFEQRFDEPVEDPVNNPNSITENRKFDDLYKDWRNRRIFTIDPTESRDLDDSLSIERLSNGNYKIGVYIADVTRFLTNDSVHDADARVRCTSIYMIDVVEHMLIPKLSQGEASILPNVLRSSLAIEWEMSEQGDVIFDSIEFNKGWIKSCCRLDYDTAQEIIEGRNPSIQVLTPFTSEEIFSDVLLMNRIAQNLRRRRRNGGAINLGSNDIHFTLDSNGYPISIDRPEHNESHQLIEEFMLMANHLTGITLHNHYGPDAVLRIHVPPEYPTFMEAILTYGRSLNTLLESKGVSSLDEGFNVWKVEEAIATYRAEKKVIYRMDEAMNSLIECCGSMKEVTQCIKHALLREMTLATYAREGDCTEESGTLHFALNMLYYTHFTSPIRRYADVLVHRQVQELILAKHENRVPVSPIHGQNLSLIIERINSQSKKAKNIQEDLNKLYLTYYIGSEIRKGNIMRTRAVIMSCGKASFTAYIPDYNAEVLCNLNGDLFVPPTYVKCANNNDEESSNTIEKIVAVWMNELEVAKKIEIFPLKSFIVDLFVQYDCIPSRLVIYNIWECDDTTIVSPIPVFEVAEKIPTPMEELTKSMPLKRILSAIRMKDFDLDNDQGNENHVNHNGEAGKEGDSNTEKHGNKSRGENGKPRGENGKPRKENDGGNGRGIGGHGRGNSGHGRGRGNGRGKANGRGRGSGRGGRGGHFNHTHADVNHNDHYNNNHDDYSNDSLDDHYLDNYPENNRKYQNNQRKKHNHRDGHQNSHHHNHHNGHHKARQQPFYPSRQSNQQLPQATQGQPFYPPQMNMHVGMQPTIQYPMQYMQGMNPQGTYQTTQGIIYQGQHYAQPQPTYYLGDDEISYIAPQ